MGVLFYNKCRIKTDVLTNIGIQEAEEKDVNFYDYDGFRLLSYTNSEALALTELPNNTAINENLTFDGWNWTLQEIKNQINNVGGVVNVGAIYHTTDGKTHITCRPIVNNYVYIVITPTVSNAVTIDWGDGNTTNCSSTSQTTCTHIYSRTGYDTIEYDITITCSEGTYSFGTYIAGSDARNRSMTYTDIRLSNNVTGFGSNCFRILGNLKSINIPNSVTSIGANCFVNCPLLPCVNIPRNVTSIGDGCFNACSSLKYVTIQNTITSLNSQCFSYCFSLQSITIPGSVTSIGSSCFNSCRSLKSVIIPNTVNSIGDGCFFGCYSIQSATVPNNITNFVTNFFYSCYSLQSITIPSGVTSVGNDCFRACESLRKIYMEPTTPPALGNTTAIQNNTNLVIYVPAGTLSVYQNETNWSTFSSKMRELN